MDTVKKDLQEKMEKMEKMEKEKKKNENLDIVKTERDFFRTEAIRLNELCSQLSNTTDELNRQNNANLAEIQYLSKKFKESEYTNKQLLLELDANIKIIKNFENEKKQYLKMHKYYEFINNKMNNSYISNINNSNANNKNNLYYNGKNKNTNRNINHSPIPNLKHLYSSSNDQSKNINKTNNYNISNNGSSFNNIIHNMNENNSGSYNLQNNSTEDIDFMASINYNSLFFESLREKELVTNIIERLRTELKKEKNRNQKIIGEFNKILLDKKSLEKTFIECVEECRTEILQRRLRDTMNSTKIGFFSLGKKPNFVHQSFPILSEVQFEHFQATDKRKLLETFLMRDEIVNFIKENLGSINSKPTGPFFQKNLNESLFSCFRQTKKKFDSKALFSGSCDFAKSRNKDFVSTNHQCEKDSCK